MNEQRTTPLERLSADATQGEWHLYAVRNTVQISDGPEPTNRAAIVHWAGFDSGDRTNREKLANARFITELVNAYRSGKLVSSETTETNWRAAYWRLAKSINLSYLADYDDELASEVRELKAKAEPTP